MKFEYKKTFRFSELESEFVAISEEIEALKFPKGFLEFVLYALSELFANVREHSKAEKVSTTVKITDRNCLIDVADEGVGFKKTYTASGIYAKDDVSAIEFALSGLSTKNLKERGFGLYSIRKLGEDLGGTLTVESGLARAIIRENTIAFVHRKQKMKGVRVGIAVPVKSLDFYKVIGQ